MTDWAIDCFHHCCPVRHEERHAHDIGPESCAECAEMTAESERARALRERAQRIAQRKADKQ